MRWASRRTPPPPEPSRRSLSGLTTRGDCRAVAPQRPLTEIDDEHGAGGVIHWPQETLRRAAMAIREARSSDTFVARKVLEATVRQGSDLLALLKPPPGSAAAFQTFQIVSGSVMVL